MPHKTLILQVASVYGRIESFYAFRVLRALAHYANSSVRSLKKLDNLPDVRSMQIVNLLPVSIWKCRFACVRIPTTEMRRWYDQFISSVWFLKPLIAKFMGPTWGPPGSCRPQMGPMLAPWTLLSGAGKTASWYRRSHSIYLRVISHISIHIYFNVMSYEGTRWALHQALVTDDNSGFTHQSKIVYLFRNKNRFVRLSIWTSFETPLQQSAPSISISIMCSRRKQNNACVHGCWPTRNTNMAALSTAWRSTDLQSSTSGMPCSPISRITRKRLMLPSISKTVLYRMTIFLIVDAVLFTEKYA